MAIEEMVANLLLNAVKYAPDEGSAALLATDVDDGVQIEVADTGIGIPTTELPHVLAQGCAGPEMPEKSNTMEQALAWHYAADRRQAQRQGRRRKPPGSWDHVHRYIAANSGIDAHEAPGAMSRYNQDSGALLLFCC